MFIRQEANKLNKEDSAMRKDKNFAYGFTVAEILISLLITAIIAAAMVPVIGLKKIRNPMSRQFHGMAECYYEPEGSPDANGDYSNSQWKLKYFYATRGNNGTAETRTIEGDQRYCTLQIP